MRMFFKRIVSVGASLALAGTMCGAGAAQAFANDATHIINSQGVDAMGAFEIAGNYAQVFSKSYTMDIITLDGTTVYSSASSSSGNTYTLYPGATSDSAYISARDNENSTYRLMDGDGNFISNTIYIGIDSDRRGNFLCFYNLDNTLWADYYTSPTPQSQPTTLKIYDGEKTVSRVSFDQYDDDEGLFEITAYDNYYNSIGNFFVLVENGQPRAVTYQELYYEQVNLADGTLIKLDNGSLVASRPNSSTPVNLRPGETFTKIENCYQIGSHIAIVDCKTQTDDKSFAVLLKDDEAGTLMVFEEGYQGYYTTLESSIDSNPKYQSYNEGIRCLIDGELWAFNAETGAGAKLDIQGVTSLSGVYVYVYGSAFKVEWGDKDYFFDSNGRQLDVSAFESDGATVKYVSGLTNGFGVIAESEVDGSKQLDVYLTDDTLTKSTAKHFTRSGLKEAGFAGNVYADIAFADSTTFSFSLYALDESCELVSREFGPYTSDGQILLSNYVQRNLGNGVRLPDPDSNEPSHHFDGYLNELTYIPDKYDKGTYLVDYIYVYGNTADYHCTLADGTRVFKCWFYNNTTYQSGYKYLDVNGDYIVRNGYILGTINGFEIAGTGRYFAADADGKLAIVDAYGNLVYDISDYTIAWYSSNYDVPSILPLGNYSDGKLYFLQVAPEQPADEPAVNPGGNSAVNPTPSATVTNVTINKSTVSAQMVKAAAKKGATTITLGSKVKKISKNAFKGTKIKTVVLKTKKLKASKVKGCFKGSKVTTVKVKVGSKKVNKKYVKKYKKIFTKKNCGKKVKVK